jgi:NAD(P)-dependent dehydrogenase (short-subunit alcohol dehydrogenase family)
MTFAREGASVIVAARTMEQVSRVKEEIQREFNSSAHAVSCDVADSRAVSLMFDGAGALFGRGPDILVNNAGVAESAPLLKTTDEFWHKHLDINLSGTFYCTRAALSQMVERGWGRIINIASIAGKTGAPYIAAYSASKHGVLGLTRSVAVEVATRGVTVNAICPGYVETEMTERAIENITNRTGRSEEQARATLEQMSPQNRLVTPEEVAEMALLLASEAGRGITGQAINIDGGSLLY